MLRTYQCYAPLPRTGQDLTEEGTSQDESPVANLPPLRKFDFRACPGIGAIDIFKLPTLPQYGGR